MGHIQSIEDLISFLIRRNAVILFGLLLGGIVGICYALGRPHNYTAVTSIEVQAAQVSSESSSELAPGSQAMQMLQSIRHRLTTRESLLAVSTKHGLFTDQPDLSGDSKVKLLRAAISFQTIAGDGGYGTASGITALVISVTLSDPGKAADIANDLAQSVLAMSASGQISRAQDSLAFYAGKRDEAEAAIRSREDEISAYRSANSAALPPAIDALRDEMTGLSAELRAVEARILTATEERRQIIARERLRPTDQQLVRDLDDLINLLREQKTALEGERAAQQKQLADVPAIERGLADLERSLEQTRRNYDAAALSLARAEADLQLAERQQVERFAVLDEATLPEFPSGPSRKSFVLAAIMGGALMGIVIGFILDLMRPVLRTSSQLQRETGLTPLMAIPELELGPKRTMRRKHLRWLVKARRRIPLR